MKIQELEDLINNKIIPDIRNFSKDNKKINYLSKTYVMGAIRNRIQGILNTFSNDNIELIRIENINPNTSEQYFIVVVRDKESELSDYKYTKGLDFKITYNKCEGSNFLFIPKTFQFINIDKSIKLIDFLATK